MSEENVNTEKEENKNTENNVTESNVTENTNNKEKTDKSQKTDKKEEKKTKDNVKKKEKKLKLGFRRTVSNIWFAFMEIWRVSKSYVLWYFGVTLVYAPIGFLNGTFLMHRVISNVEENKPLKSTILFILIIAAIEISANLMSGFYWNVMSAGVWQRIAGKLYEKLYRKSAAVELACYENPEYYDKFVKALDEVENRVWRVLRSLDNLMWQITSLLLNSFFIFWIDPWLILFAIIPIALGFIGSKSKKLKHDHTADRKPVERRMSYVRRTCYEADYSKEMRLGGMQSKMIGDLSVCFGEYIKVLKKYGFKRSVCDFLVDWGLDVLTVLGATAYAVIRALTDGGMSVADCIVVCSSIGSISYCVNRLVSSVTDFNEHAVYLEDVRSFLEYKIKIVDGPEKLIPAESSGEISFDHVTFRYEGAENDSLTDVSFNIKPGERIALVGLNGSGKTTLVKLLLRLYDPTEGKVTLDNTDVKEYAVQAYRDHYSCVFQDFGMFSMSVKDNVALGQFREGDDEKIKEALENSGASKKIDSLKNGMETVLTREFDDQGTNLSVGESQKVALARAFYRQAPVIILDEPSSALDPRAEWEMFENMKKAAEGKTVIFISHRLSSAVDADRILLLSKGKLTESGTHAELLALDGEYAKMFRLQAQNYAESSEETEDDE